MSDNTIFVNRYEANQIGQVDLREVYRYAGYMGVTSEADDALTTILEETLTEVLPVLSYKVCYRRIPREDFTLGMDSKGLTRCLGDSTEVILFAATIGLDIDRKIARYQRISPTKALLLQAIGAERVEALCDKFCAEFKTQEEQKGNRCTMRFSPGYGDLPLETQREVFELLDCNRQIGISLNTSLLMTPSKSVTAIFGIGSGNK